MIPGGLGRPAYDCSNPGRPVQAARIDTAIDKWKAEYDMIKTDILIVGAGITGTMLAKDLSMYDVDVVVLDKDNDIADGSTMANSAIVHTGYDPEDGTLKAKLNVAGRAKYEKLCRDLGCRYLRCGAYVAACGTEEEEELKVLADRADRRGIPYRVLSGDEARREEKNLSDSVTKALDFYTTAVIYPWQVAIGCAELAYANGARFFLNCEVTAIEKTAEGFTVTAGGETFEAKMVINAAGVFSDTIAKMVEEDPGFTIRPRRGEYYVLDKDIDLVSRVIFPVPTQEKGKGVLVVPTVYGNVLLGPNSDYIADKDDNGTSVDGLKYVMENVGRTVKNVPFGRIIRTFAGIRSASTSRDFIIEEAKTVPGFINVASIESPGLASAPGISEYVIDNLISPRIRLEKKADPVTKLEKKPVLSEMSDEERNELVRQRPEYGRIVCRCEQVSEGEIIDAMQGPFGARTVKGVKKRCRPGMGRCQGGFCEPLVLDILARHLGKDPMDIVLDSVSSPILEVKNR